MKIVLDIGGNEPLNEQIRLQIMRGISDGSIKADECLPSIRFVARELGIGVITVKTAYEKLEADGLIYTVAGKGCFVSSAAVKDLTDKKSELLRSRLKPALDYCKSIGASDAEIIEAVKDLLEK